MPTTINGIGTHYYGKKNWLVRQGNCHSCGRLVNLESYDTRLWFVVVFDQHFDVQPSGYRAGAAGN